MSPSPPDEPSLAEELRSSALLLSLLVVVVSAGIGIGLLVDLVS
jgi:hypothetical protein